MTVQTTGSTDNQERRRNGIWLNSVVSNILISFFQIQMMKAMVMMENQEVKKTRKMVKRRSQNMKLILVSGTLLRRKVDFM